MKSGVTTVSLIPMRSAANERSELINQLVFGDYFELIQTHGKWLKVKSIEDNYEGWIDRQMAGPITEEDIPDLNDLHVIQPVLCELKDEQNQIMRIVAGSRIPQPDLQGGFRLRNKQYTFMHSDFADFLTPKSHITETAKQFLNSPYLWGGKSILGIDCSGFIQIIFRMHGHSLPRDASQQVDFGETICFRHDAQAGDLAFFQNNKGKIVHVGLILNQEHIIHASGKVRIDKMDHSGIYNNEIKQYTHELSVIKRISL